MTLLPPTVEQQERIDRELRHDKEMLRRDISSLREWLKKQPHLPQYIGKSVSRNEKKNDLSFC